MIDVIELTALEDWESYEDFCQKALKITRSQIKKYDLPSRKIKGKDKISIPANLLNNGLISPFYKGPEIDIIYEDQDFLVVNKPPFINGHPLHYCEEDNILSWIRSSGDQEKLKVLNIDQQSHERGLLYRLDRETSGVLVLAKKDSIYQNIRKNFNQCAKEKIYTALVSGHLKKQGELLHYLLPYGEKGYKQLAFDTLNDVPLSKRDEAKEAKLVIDKIVYEGENTKVTIRLITGLRHQIRSQLASLGHPILGDELYGGKGERRLFLHATIYTLLFNEKNYHFHSPVPF